MSLTFSIFVPCQHLSTEVGFLLELLKQQLSLRGQDIPAVQAFLHKVISPTFKIVFTGTFSAGKSMLINALLGRELLYSTEGYAAETKYHLAYAEAPDEQTVPR
jgi:GTPase SAR1 family protein